MSVCLTKKQTEFFKIVSKYRDEHGYYPSISETAKMIGRKPGNVVNYYGALFLRGVFSDGKPQTRYHAEAHVRTERRAQAQRTAARAQTRRASQPVAMDAAKKRRVAEALVKLLSGESEDQSVLLDIAHLMR